MCPARRDPLINRTHVESLAQRTRKNDGATLHLIKTYDRTERPCWFLLRAPERGLLILERTAYDVLIDLTEFGEVVASGWGHTPAIPLEDVRI